MTEYKRYRNSFYNPKRFSSQEWITARLDESPEEYKGYLIYRRIDEDSGDNIFDIVNKDVCIGMCAGINGAKRSVDWFKERAICMANDKEIPELDELHEMD
jgi:hypothetical protein